MATYQAKTTENENSVIDFIKSVSDLQKQKDCFTLMELMQQKSGYPAKMWGTAIIGFGSYHYIYASGHEGDAPLIGFSPRKSAIVLYLSTQFNEREALLQILGKHSCSKACIYVKKLANIDLDVLGKMIEHSLKQHTHIC